MYVDLVYSARLLHVQGTYVNSDPTRYVCKLQQVLQGMYVDLVYSARLLHVQGTYVNSDPTRYVCKLGVQQQFV